MTATQVITLPSGLRLHCRFAGDPAQRPMLLLHALGESGADWDSVTPALSVDYRLVIPDLRGHGDSDWPGGYSFELMRDDVLALMDRLGIVQAVLIGHSMGRCCGVDTRPDRATARVAPNDRGRASTVPA